MMSDPEDKQSYVLLETDNEAQAAFDVGLINEKPEYVIRQEKLTYYCGTFHKGPPYYFKTDKKFIRIKRDIDKIKLMLRKLDINV